MRILLVGNPTAQSGKNKERIEAALDEFLARGVEAELVTTEPEGRTIPKVRERIDHTSCDVVVYMGGDGTFREVAAAVVLAERDVPMGMLPSGTANDQGKSFGIRSGAARLEENIDVVLQGCIQRIDGGRIVACDDAGAPVDEALFFDSAGFGMHPAILMGRNRDRELVARIPLLGSVYRDQAVYVGAAIREALRSYVGPSSFEAHVTADGVEHRFDGLTDLIVKGTPVYGGIWVPARDGAPDDGLFDVIPLRGRTDMVAKLIRDWKDLPVDPGPISWLGLTYEGGFAAAEFDIELVGPLGRPIPSQIDGEEWLAGSRFRIQVLKQALPLIVRRDWLAPWATG
ncbi:MAG: diacylglycerol kinase family protein [Myxococcota bacterium]